MTLSLDTRSIHHPHQPKKTAQSGWVTQVDGADLSVSEQIIRAIEAHDFDSVIEAHEFDSVARLASVVYKAGETISEDAQQALNKALSWALDHKDYGGEVSRFLYCISATKAVLAEKNQMSISQCLVSELKKNDYDKAEFLTRLIEDARVPLTTEAQHFLSDKLREAIKVSRHAYLERIERKLQQIIGPVGCSPFGSGHILLVDKFNHPAERLERMIHRTKASLTKEAEKALNEELVWSLSHSYETAERIQRVMKGTRAHLSERANTALNRQLSELIRNGRDDNAQRVLKIMKGTGATLTEAVKEVL